MSEMNNEENKNEQNRIQVEAYLNERATWMADAVELIAGDREADPLQVFPAPGEVRASDAGLKLTPEEEVKLRELAGRFGIGGEADVKSGAVVQIMEGGKPWKVEAEAAISDDASTLIFAGSPYRSIGQDESSYLAEKFGVEDKQVSEYEMVTLLATSQEGFVPLGEPEVQPFGYDITNNNTLIHESTGQLVKIGEIDDKSVMLLRVDRENYIDEEGKNKYRNQPDSAALLGIVGGVLTECGDNTSSVGINSSTAYASRSVDTVRAGLHSGRKFEVGMYGHQTLADVRSQEVATPTDINQIPGELHEMYVKLQQLKAEL